MKPVYQTIIEAGNGNCFAACIASLLELRIDEVPNFYDYREDGYQNFWKGLQVYLEPFGLTYVAVGSNALYGKAEIPLSMLRNMHVILKVPSQKFPDRDHAILGYYDGTKLTIAHDPNPDNKPYDTDQVKAIGFLVRKF